MGFRIISATSLAWLVAMASNPAVAEGRWGPATPGDRLELSIAIKVPAGTVPAALAPTDVQKHAEAAASLLDHALQSAPLAEAAPVRKDTLLWVDSTALQTFTKSRGGECNPEGRVGSRAQAWEAAYACLKTLGSNHKLLGLAPEGPAALHVVEPVLDLQDADYQRRAVEQRAAEAVQARAGNPIRASRVWPTGPGPGWHLGDSYSELATAGQRVGALDGVRVAHLDTGYLPEAASLPRHFRADLSATCDRLGCKLNGRDPYAGGLGKSPGHGPATLSTLAGASYTLGGREYQLGAAPGLQVFSVDIGDSVVHPDSRRMATGILYAVGQGADVITMSHGGLPSARLAAAINEAYESGTAVFAATGDYFDLLFGYTFREVVYPARYPRVMGVAGITEQHESYGDDPSWRWLVQPGPGYLARLGSWALRGNYGPESAMRDHVIAAYAPNITRAVPSASAPGLIGDNGAGTSHATPQAAAAAALWLEHNRANFSDDEWRSWRKTQAVYSALAKSADRCFADYTIEHYGVGVLKANQALHYRYGNGAISRPTGEPIPLEMKPEADLDLKGVVSLLRSTSLFSSFSATVRNALVEAVTTELSQLAMTSERVNKLLQRTKLCEVQPGCQRCTRQDAKLDIAKLAKAVGRLDEASPTLKKMLAQAAKG